MNRIAFAALAVAAASFLPHTFSPALAQTTQNAQPATDSILLDVIVIPKALLGCWNSPGHRLELHHSSIVLDGARAWIRDYKARGKDWINTNFVVEATKVVLATRLDLGNGANGAKPSELIVSNRGEKKIFTRCEAPAPIG